jgi:FdhD protein
MSNPSTTRHPAITRLLVQKVNAAGRQHAQDQVVVEEPLEIRLVYGPALHRIEKSISVTMRTPGNDAELATGFLFTEGIIPNATVILSQNHGEAAESNIPADNLIRIALDEHIRIDIDRLQRHFYTSSSCGVCGKSSIDAIRTVRPPYASKGESSPESAKAVSKKPATNLAAGEVENVAKGITAGGWQVDTSLLYTLPQSLRQHQDIFESTGGLHASALFDLNGELLFIREDIGRHNALDKLIGLALQQDLLPLQDHILLLSGRACFELIQKAAMAGICMIAAIGPPSSLAVQLAEEYGITLIGFLREERFNIYAGSQRVQNLLP